MSNRAHYRVLTVLLWVSILGGLVAGTLALVALALGDLGAAVSLAISGATFAITTAVFARLRDTL